MSKNIVIQEGGVPRQLTADKLDTNLNGGGTCNWIPEDMATLGTKSISENGTYKAVDDGLYGYSEVSVSGIGQAIGKDSQGRPTSVSVDADGNLVVRELPDSIAITVQPTKLQYNDGDPIDLSGIEVTAYKHDGTVWDDTSYPGGIIPIAELAFTPTEADIDAVRDKQATSPLVQTPITISSAQARMWRNEQHSGYNYYGGGDCANIFYLYDTRFRITLAGANAFSGQYYEVWDIQDGRHYNERALGTLSYTYSGKTVHYTQNDNSAYYGIEGTVDPIAHQESPNAIAWTMIYGSITGGTQAIEIAWSRPEDGVQLKTTLEIEVVRATGGGGTTEGGGGAGRND